MNDDDIDWEAFADLSQRYEARFGERPPLREMPPDPEAQIRAIRQALDDGQPYRSTIPEDAYT